MDAPAPAVVAVVVTRDPGPWLEETLAALANQDYSELSLLVFVSGGHEDPTPRVARVAPDAFVRRFEEPAGFAETANHVLEMVEGESFFLFCWDDCALDPQGLHILVEESFRSNAGIVSPKMVSWDDPRTLVHVGRNADKTGAVGERVRRDELDQGQHDNVREVFVAPSGCTLVRSDLFRQLRGFDPVIDGVGEDLDLCWRAWVAGALVVAAPDARARVLEASVGGLSPTPTSDGS